MHRFFAEPASGNMVRLDPVDAQHALRVLRLQPGDDIAVVCKGTLYSARMSGNDTAEIISVLPSPEPLTRITIYQGIPKGDRMDFIAQKCTEAGVFCIRLVEMSRCIGTGSEKKTGRWQRIAREAAKQSGRIVVPEIVEPISFEEMLDSITRHEQVLVPWEERGESLRLSFPFAHDVAVVIGPEGGIEKNEVERMQERGALPVTLGPRIFRTETAGLVATIAILMLCGDMD